MGYVLIVWVYSPIEVSSCVKSSLMKEATYYLVFQENDVKRIWNVCGSKVKHIIKCILSVGLCQHSQSVWAPGVTYLCEEPRASFPKCLFDKISFILPPTLSLPLHRLGRWLPLQSVGWYDVATSPVLTD